MVDDLSRYDTGYLRMLNSDGLSRCGDVEHVEDDGLVASVLATVDSADNLYDGLTFTEGVFGSVLADNGQFALLHNAVVDDIVVVPTCFGSYRKHHSVYHQFRSTGRVVGQGGHVPGLRTSQQFGGLDSHILLYWFVCFGKVVQRYEKKLTFASLLP